MTIQITDDAKADIDWFATYLTDNFTTLELVDFDDRLQLFYSRVIAQPEAYPFADKAKNVRTYLLHKNTRVYYQYHKAENRVVVLRLFDTRQHPDKLVFAPI